MDKIMNNINFDDLEPEVRSTFMENHKKWLEEVEKEEMSIKV